MAVRMRIKELREAQGLRQVDLAARFSKPVDPARISKWENGVELPRAETLVELAHVLGCAIGDLFVPSDYVRQ